MIRPCVLGWLTGVLLAVGCGPSGPKKYDVSGTVKVDGQPVPNGDVVFHPADPKAAPEGGIIKDGKYAVKALEGVNKVEIRGTRVVPGKKGPMGEDFIESMVPDTYNDKSTLKVEVGPGKTEHNFDLKK